jgi:hypothetical protein
MKTIERNVYLEVEDSPEGGEILGKFILLLAEVRHNKAYLNGWIAPLENDSCE